MMDVENLKGNLHRVLNITLTTGLYAVETGTAQAFDVEQFAAMNQGWRVAEQGIAVKKVD